MSRSEVVALVNEVLYPDPRLRSRSAFNANYLGKLEEGLIHWPKPEYRATLRTALSARTDQELGFYNPRAVKSATVDDVDRRGMLGAIGVLVGAGVVSAPTLALLDTGPSHELPRRIGNDHITAVMEAADIFEHWDNSHGGALAREIADDKLRRLAQLLRRPCPPKLRGDLHTAMAQLAGVVAFMLFDAYDHDAARRKFTFALQCAEVGGNWHQRALLLSYMARQAIWCGQPDDGLTYVEMGLVRAERLTATERAMLNTVRARALAKLGPTHAQEALAAVGTADDAFARSQPADDPPWMRFYDDAQHHGDTAHALYDVAMHTTLATEAVSRFQYSVEHHQPEFARSRAISRTKLASLTMVQGDPLEAAHIGQLALADAGAIRSRRTADDLRELHRVAGSHASIPEVSSLRAAIDATVKAAA
ncbi:hypothetical protein [Micromonospora sp. NPDC047527]|uniref:hypothetical protein n=1 Tax=unclassified Micromonospora TaxID=2617518 RepID=UPI00340C2667